MISGVENLNSAESCNGVTAKQVFSRPRTANSSTNITNVAAPRAPSLAALVHELRVRPALPRQSAVDPDELPSLCTLRPSSFRSKTQDANFLATADFALPLRR
jgi:hypothetical protein